MFSRKNWLSNYGESTTNNTTNNQAAARNTLISNILLYYSIFRVRYFEYNL